MNRAKLRLAQRLVRLRRQAEQIDRLALAGLRAQQARVEGRLGRLGETARARDAQALAVLSRGTAAGRDGNEPGYSGPQVSDRWAWLAEYRRQVGAMQAQRAQLGGQGQAFVGQMRQRGRELAESMARRKAAELLLGRLATQQAARESARQQREQDELRVMTASRHEV